MSGYDVARALREDARTEETLLIALTGYGRAEDRRRCLEEGFSAHLTKPVDASSILRTLIHLQNKTG